MRIRILLGNLPGMLGDIVKSIVKAQPDMELVGTVGGNEDLAAAAERLLPDAIILGGQESCRAAACRQLVVERPRLKIVAVGDDGRRADLYEFRKVPVAPLSPQGLVAAIRAAVQSGAA